VTTNIERAIGTFEWDEFGGKELRMSPFTPEDKAEIAAYYRGTCDDPLKQLSEIPNDLNPEVAKALALQIWEDHKTYGDINSLGGQEWWQSLEGMAFTLWRAYSKDDTLITREWVLQKAGDMLYVDLIQKMQKYMEISGIADSSAGNSSRMPIAPISNPKKKTGSGYSGRSPKGTHGHRPKK